MDNSIKPEWKGNISRFSVCIELKKASSTSLPTWMAGAGGFPISSIRKVRLREDLTTK